MREGKLTGDLARIALPDTDVEALPTEELIDAIAMKLAEKYV